MCIALQLVNKAKKRTTLTCVSAAGVSLPPLMM